MAKLLGNTEAQPALNNANGILKSVSIALPLINCKVELELMWTNYCVLSAPGNDNANDNANNIIFYYQRHKIIRSCSNFISKRQSKIIKTSDQRIQKISLLK